MTKQEFIKALSKGRKDVIQSLLDLLRDARAEYCVIGGLAVNAYAEPVVSLDLDVVIEIETLETFARKGKTRFKIERFPHSVNLSVRGSDLRIQIQTDPRYQEFIPRASRKKVLGYSMKVAALEDVLQGKLWAFSDARRRQSKRQKDLADIYRLVENHPRLKKLLPRSLRV